jgi:hypothetical protein
MGKFAENSPPKTSIWNSIVIIFFIVLAVFSNPNAEDHQSRLKSFFDYKANSRNQNESGDIYKEISKELVKELVNHWLEEGLIVTDYLFFSTSHLRMHEDEGLVGIGVFGIVIIPAEIIDMWNDLTS